MTSFLKKSFLALAAGALALAMPLMAQAAVLPLNLGFNTNIDPGNVYEFEFNGALPGGTNTFLFPFIPSGSPGLAITANTGQVSGGGGALAFSNPVFEITGPGGPFASGNLTILPGILAGSIEDVPLVLGGNYLLTLAFDLPTAGGEVQVSVNMSVVPLPAAGLLLLAGLGGLGLVARRRKVAAA